MSGSPDAQSKGLSLTVSLHCRAGERFHSLVRWRRGWSGRRSRRKKYPNCAPTGAIGAPIRAQEAARWRSRTARPHHGIAVRGALQRQPLAAPQHPVRLPERRARLLEKIGGLGVEREHIVVAGHHPRHVTRGCYVRRFVAPQVAGHPTFRAVAVNGQEGKIDGERAERIFLPRIQARIAALEDGPLGALDHVA